VPKQLVIAPRKAAIRTALLLAGSLIALTACAALPQQPLSDQAEVASSSQAADGPQTGAWSMQ
jgi:hypothetical protein